MKRRFKFTSTVRDAMKRFLRGEYAQEQPDEKTLTEAEETPSTPDVPISDKAEKPGEQAKQDKPPVKDVSPALLCYAQTHVGKVRASNQDALIQGDKFYGVADGMGGHKGGETASAEVRDGLIQLLEGKTPAIDTLRQAVEKINLSLYRQQQQDEKLSGMGTTLTALWFSERYVYIAQVGDSRAYRMRGGKLHQMTSDHSLVAELVRSGVLTPEQAADHPMRNVITRAVGTEDTVDVDILVEERQKGDLWLVCSDGLYGMTSDAAMEAIMKGSAAADCPRKLVDAALEGGGHDNVSVVILLDLEGSR